MSALLVSILAVTVGILAVVASTALAAAFLLATLMIVGIAILSWRQSTAKTNRRRRISWPRVLAASALVCYMLSTLTFRGRSASAIASNPVDSAGFVRVSLLGGAVLLGLAALRACAAMGLRGKRLEPPTKVYLLYIALAVASLPMAIDPGYSLFSIADFAVLAFTYLVAARAFRGDELLILRVILGFLAFLVATVALGVLVAPARAVVHQAGSPIHVRVQGIFPQLSFNTLGTFGMFFFAAGLAGQRPRRTLLVAGPVIVILAQYRTGYIASIVILAVYLLSQRRMSRVLFAFALIGSVILMTHTPEFQNLWSRGSTSENVATLSGRVNYWHASLSAVGRSPIVGLGLKSGTRFEVLVNAGEASTSSVHNTWVEALVGEGVLGLAALLVAFLLAFVRAVLRIRTSEGLLAVLLFTAIAVRSVTGTTIELAGVTALLFLATASLCGDSSLALHRPAENAVSADDSIRTYS